MIPIGKIPLNPDLVKLPIPSDVDYLITEDGDFLITEDGDFLITEES